MTDDFIDGLPDHCADCPLPVLCKMRGCFGPVPLSIGVTGTRNTRFITREAQNSLAYFLHGLRQQDPADRATVHHGCCTGWDAMVHHTARAKLCYIHAHPPADKKHMASLLFGQYVRWEDEKPYAERNQAIVDATGLLLAYPAFPQDDPRSGHSGTWQTIRMARVKGVPILFFRPNGSRVLEWEGRTYVLDAPG